MVKMKKIGAAVNTDVQHLDMDWSNAPPCSISGQALYPPSAGSPHPGFDIIMTNSVQSIDSWQNTYGHPTGSELGFFGASTSIGEIVGIFFAFFLTDWWGRKRTVALGSLIVIVGVFVESWAPNVNTFAGGKTILGVGTIIAQVAGPILCTELAHPKDRVTVMGIYGAGLYLGQTTGAWISYGTNSISGNWAWRLPVLLQIAVPVYQVIFIWFCPESPRWMMNNDRQEQALDFLVKYHGNGERTEYIDAEFTEIRETLAMENQWAKETSWFDIINAPGNRKRLFIAICVGTFSQTLGANLISTYLPVVLQGIGYTSARTKLLINGLETLWATGFCAIGGLISPYVKRRSHFLWGTTGMLAAFLGWTVASQQYSKTGAKAAGQTVLGLVFVHTAFNSISWIVITIAYPLECMPMKLRTKFFCVLSMSIQLGAVFSAYVVPIGLENIGWKYYIYNTIWIACAMVIIYFFFVETKGPSLEEIAIVFDGADALVGGTGRTMMPGDKAEAEQANSADQVENLAV